MLESKEEDEQTVVVVLKFASETLLSPSNVALAKRNPSLRPATKSSELIKFARRVKLCFVHLCYGWLGGLQGFQLELNRNILVSLEGEIELVSKELNHFGVIAGLFGQIGGHSSRFVLFCSF